MRRVITVSLGGNAYQLDEDAYERLRAHVASTESQLRSSPDRVQLVGDMERSIGDQIVAMRIHTNDAVVSDATMLQVLTNIGGAQAANSTAQQAAASGGQPLNAYSSRSDSTLEESEYTRLPVFILCLFLGWFGLHRMFVGKIGTGLLQLVTIGGLGIWTLYDLILIVFASFTDADGRKIVRWA